MTTFKQILLITLVMFIATPLLGSAQTTNDFPLDVLWKAQTFVPADYSGKPLASKESTITVFALTPNKNPKNIEFTWVVKDISSQARGADKKGVGANTFTFQAEKIVPNFTHKIAIYAKELYTGRKSEAWIEIPVVSTEVYIYSIKDNWNSFINNRMNGSRGSVVNIIAKPFYFPVTSLSNLTFRWLFDGEDIFSPGETDLLSFDISSQSLLATERSFSVEVDDGRTRNRASSLGSLFITP